MPAWQVPAVEVVTFVIADITQPDDDICSHTRAENKVTSVYRY